MTTNVTERTYTIEITVTEREAEFLHGEIHNVYKALKDDKNFDDFTEKDWEVRRERMNILRDLRNAFATPLRTYYMGEDA